jgi:hypothetical protein
LNPGEDEVEGLKRLLTEVLIIFPFQNKHFLQLHLKLAV